MIILQISLIFISVFPWAKSEQVYDLTHGFIDITGLFEPSPHIQPSGGHSPRNEHVSSVISDVINLKNIEQSEITKPSANASSEQPTNTSTSVSESTDGKIDNKQSINTEKTETTTPKNTETVQLSRNSTTELKRSYDVSKSKSSGKGKKKQQAGKTQKRGKKQKGGKLKRRQKQQKQKGNAQEKPGSKPTTTKTFQITTVRPAPPAAPQRYPLANQNIPNSRPRSNVYPPQNHFQPRNTMVANPQPNSPYTQGAVGQGTRIIPSQTAPQTFPQNGGLPNIPNNQTPVSLQTKPEPSIRRRPVQTTTKATNTTAPIRTTTKPTTTPKPCHACGCFEKYFDRDSELPLMPYAQAVYVSEEECLTLCFAEGESCKSVSYGIVSGRSGLACELYNESALPNRLYYRYAMNYFDKNMRQEACDPRKIVPIDLKTETPDESPYYRKRSGMEAVKRQLGTARKPE